jgi:hypothetical protein
VVAAPFGVGLSLSNSLVLSALSGVCSQAHKKTRHALRFVRKAKSQHQSSFTAPSGLLLAGSQKSKASLRSPPPPYQKQEFLCPSGVHLINFISNFYVLRII